VAELVGLQTRLNSATADQRLIRTAHDIIEKGSCAVSKPIRAGFTSSAIMACEMNGRRTLVLEPTGRILKETMLKATGNRAIRVPGNQECPMNQKEIQDYPILAQIPLGLEDCSACPALSYCPVLEILRADDYDTAGLTYFKLEALMLSKSKTAKEILVKLSRAEVILMDEAHVISLPSLVSIPPFVSLEIPTPYRTLNRVYLRWHDLCQTRAEVIKDVMLRAAQGHAGQHLSRPFLNPDPLSWSLLKKAWGELRSLAKSGEMGDKEILQLRDMITILGSFQAAVTYISADEGESGAVYITSGQGQSFRALREFLQHHVRRARHVYASGTLFELRPGFFTDLSGKDIRNTIYPDIRRATRKLTLIPDRWRLGSRDFTRRLPQILETIKAIAERERQPIYLLAPSAKKAGIIRAELTKMGLQDILVDYYRSDQTQGVERQERVCVSIGLAEIPSNSYDVLARGRDTEDRWQNSQCIRRQAVDAATWQAVNRVRDPEGRDESRVYFVGVRLDRVRQVAAWGTNRQVEVVTAKETETSDGRTIRTPITEVTVDEQLELPNIIGDGRNAGNSQRRVVSDFIAKIELNKNNFKNSENHHKTPTYTNRGNVVKLRIFNNPSNKNEVELTSNSLYSMFAHRTDCHAQQYKNTQTGKWEFHKVLSPLTVDKLKAHVAGQITLGTYEIGLNDTVTWACDDIDSHNGEQYARQKVARVVAVLRKYGIPFLVEASGSKDSYHVWIFVARTKTYNAFVFIRQVNAEAGINCECWPKQKGLHDKNGKYGNLLKIPICYHQKSAGWSAFIDPDTFEPLENPIDHPGLVHLLEIPELSGNALSMSALVKSRREAAGKSGAKVNSNPWSRDLDYCMNRALEDRVPLEGPEGHHLRLAIAIKAQKIGMMAEDAARLFKHQRDYSYDFSLAKVQETWRYDYSPWSCRTLKDKCGSLVKGYCSTCPCHYAYGAPSSVEAVNIAYDMEKQVDLLMKNQLRTVVKRSMVRSGGATSYG
jgi:hypothetical protein